jgi:hypothetical protein
VYLPSPRFMRICGLGFGTCRVKVPQERTRGGVVVQSARAWHPCFGESVLKIEETRCGRSGRSCSG